MVVDKADDFRERQIEVQRENLTQQTTHTGRQVTQSKLFALIKARSPAQVKRMEKSLGLAENA